MKYYVQYSCGPDGVSLFKYKDKLGCGWVCIIATKDCPTMYRTENPVTTWTGVVTYNLRSCRMISKFGKEYYPIIGYTKINNL